MTKITPQLSEAQCQSYQEDGYLVVSGVFASTEIAELTNACDDLSRMAAEFSEDAFVDQALFKLHRDANPFSEESKTLPPVAGKLRRVTYPYLVNKTFDRMRLQPNLLGVVSSLLGPTLKQVVNQVNYHYPGSTAAWGWHQDYRFRKPGIVGMPDTFVQSVLALDLCNASTGGLRLVPQSHLLGDLKLDVDNDNAEHFFDARKAITPELEPGDVLLFNSHIIHGSQPNLSQTMRRVFINGFAHASSSVGMLVLENGCLPRVFEGKMEYEGDGASLVRSTKY